VVLLWTLSLVRIFFVIFLLQRDAKMLPKVFYENIHISEQTYEPRSLLWVNNVQRGAGLYDIGVGAGESRALKWTHGPRRWIEEWTGEDTGQQGSRHSKRILMLPKTYIHRKKKSICSNKLSRDFKKFCEICINLLKVKCITKYVVREM
jgi:hypothetical protein